MVQLEHITHFEDTNFLIEDEDFKFVNDFSNQSPYVLSVKNLSGSGKKIYIQLYKIHSNIHYEYILSGYKKLLYCNRAESFYIDCMKNMNIKNRIYLSPQNYLTVEEYYDLIYNDNNGLDAIKIESGED